MGNLFNEDFSKKYLYPMTCPVCKSIVTRSEYLRLVFREDILMEYLANLVTHWRHEHRTSWNRCWGAGGAKYRSKWFRDYETEKQQVNEAAKRQLITKAWPVFRELGITPEHFSRLQYTTEETMALAYKHLRK